MAPQKYKHVISNNIWPAIKRNLFEEHAKLRSLDSEDPDQAGYNLVLS